jgi:RNA polymerase sigma-70 factor, ECF subfamily
MPPDDPAEEQFACYLADARRGDARAVDQVLLLTEQRLRRYIDARLGPQLRGSLRNSDVLQNSYIEMLDALPRFAGSTRDDFVAWVTRIIEHDIQRQHRWFGAQKRKQPRTSERNALAQILLDPPLTPSAELAGTEQRLLVRRALGQLEPDHARVIELALLEELPHREVAERLGRSEGACRMLLQRARAALALVLERLTRESR